MNVLADYLAELVNAQFEARKPKPIPEGITLEELYQLSSKGHMNYLILGALLKLDDLPDQWKNTMRQRVMVSISKTVAQVSELKEMKKRFEEEGIVNQPMKGAWMKFVYPSPEMREMSDIDVLIRQDCMVKAATELQEMGYKLVSSIKHHDIYSRPPFMSIEAHRAMYDKTVDKDQYNYFSDFTRAKLVEGCKYTYNFDINDFYIYMIAHMAKHFYTMGCGIRNLLDIYVYLEAKGKELNREYVNQELDKIGLRTFTEQMEALAYAWMEQGECTELQQYIFDYMVESGIYGKDENGIWNKFAEEKMKGKEVSRFRLKLWYYFPPIYYMSEYYPYLEKYPYLYPWSWIVRSCRGIFFKKGVYKREMLRDIDKERIMVYQKIYQTMDLHFNK